MSERRAFGEQCCAFTASGGWCRIKATRRYPNGAGICTRHWRALSLTAQARCVSIAGPVCGHSACSQHYIDTGDASCIAGKP